VSNVYKLRRQAFPSDPSDCLEKMLASSRAGKLTGLAFVALLSNNGFIADTCGEASVKPDETRQMLKTLDAKIAKRILNAR